MLVQHRKYWLSSIGSNPKQYNTSQVPAPFQKERNLVKCVITGAGKGKWLHGDIAELVMHIGMSQSNLEPKSNLWKDKNVLSIKCKSKCLSSDIPESLADCTIFYNPSTGTYSIIVSSPLGDSEISGTIQQVLFCQAPTTAEWEDAERNEFTWHFYMTKQWELNPDLLIVSPTPYPLGQMLPGYSVITYPSFSNCPTLEIAHFMIAIIYSHSYFTVIVSVPSLLLNNCTSLYSNCNTH